MHNTKVMCVEEWKDILTPVKININQRKNILRGKEDSHAGKAKLISIFGEIPDSIWKVSHGQKLDMQDRTQDVVSESHRNDTLKLFDSSTRNKNVRWKGALSIFPIDILNKLLEFYSERGDVFFDPFCVSGDTKISTPEGDIPIADLVGKEFYVYCSDGNRIRLRKAHNVRKTRENVETVKVEYEDGGSIVLTPNHKVMLLNGSWVNAKDLNTGDSLMPFYRTIHKQSGRFIIRKAPSRWVRQSRFIMSEILGRELTTDESVHHLDKNEKNDSVDNLKLIGISAHGKLHHKKGIPPYMMTEQTKEKISEKSTGRNLGKRHTHATIIKMKENSGQTRTKKIIKIKELLQLDNYTNRQIAEMVGVHPNTVGNISRNKYHYNHKVKSVTVGGNMDVYNMEVEEFNNFVANGIIVHNCGHNSRMEASFKKGRNYIGYDISHEFMEFNRGVAKELLKNNPENLTIQLKEQDSRTIDEPDNSVDFIFSSPPYHCLEWYGDEPEQLGKLSYEEFIQGMTDVYRQCYRILKPGKFCIMNVNDFRLKGKYYSYHTDTINAMKEAGFSQYDIIIMKYGNAMRKCFPNQILEEKLLPKIHEYILVFYKAPKEPHSVVYPFTPKKKKVEEK